MSTFRLNILIYQAGNPYIILRFNPKTPASHAKMTYLRAKRDICTGINDADGRKNLIFNRIHTLFRSLSSQIMKSANLVGEHRAIIDLLIVRALKLEVYKR